MSKVDNRWYVGRECSVYGLVRPMTDDYVLDVELMQRLLPNVVALNEALMLEENCLPLEYGNAKTLERGKATMMNMIRMAVETMAMWSRAE